MRLAFISLFLILSQSAWAQYKPMVTDPKLRDSYIESCKEKLKEDKKNIKLDYPSNSSEIIKTFELRANQNIAKAKSGEYIIHKETHQYFESLLERIANANPYLDFTKIHILLGNSSVPNAY